MAAVLMSLIPFLGPKKVKATELVVFTRQLSTIVNAGLPLMQGLDILAMQTDDANFRNILTQLGTDVEGGATFSEALEVVLRTLITASAAAGPSGPIEVEVVGAATTREAETVAYAVAESRLVRACLEADLPVWSAVLSAAGSADVRFDPSLLSLQVVGETVYIGGRPAEELSPAYAGKLAAGPVTLQVDLGVGEQRVTMWSYPLPTAQVEAPGDLRADPVPDALRSATELFVRPVHRPFGGGSADGAGK